MQPLEKYCQFQLSPVNNSDSALSFVIKAIPIKPNIYRKGLVLEYMRQDKRSNRREGLYYLCSENKDADPLYSYCTADLCICFCKGKIKFVFFFHEMTRISYFTGADPGFLKRGFKWSKGGFVCLILNKIY